MSIGVCCLIGPFEAQSAASSAELARESAILTAAGWQVHTARIGRETDAGAVSLSFDGSPVAVTDTEDVRFGDAGIEDALIRLLDEHQVDVVRLRLAGPSAIPGLIERCWLYGVPTVVTQSDGWGVCACVRAGGTCQSATCSSGDLQRLLERHIAECLPLADVVATDSVASQELLARGAWAPVPPVLHMDDSPEGAARWSEFLRVVAGREPRLVPTVSTTVLLTTYSRPEALRRCLASLARQTLPSDSYDVLVVDDCSPLPVDHVVAAFREQLRIRLVRTPRNLGPGGARNIGIDQADGDIVFLLDDDDELAPRCLEEHVRVHQEHPEVNIAVLGYTGVACDVPIDATTRHVMVSGGEYMNYRSLQHGQVLDYDGFWCGRSSLKRKLLDSYRFETRLCEDTDLAFRLRAEGLRVIYNRRAVQRVTGLLDHDTFVARCERIGRSRFHVSARHQHAPISGIATVSDCQARFASTAAGWEWSTALFGQLRHQPLSALRSTAFRFPDGESERALDIADIASNALYSHAYDLGFLTAEVVARRRHQQVPVRLAVAGDSPQLTQTTSALAPAISDGRAQLLVGSQTCGPDAADLVEGPVTSWRPDDPLPAPRDPADLRALLDGAEYVGELR